MSKIELIYSQQSSDYIKGRAYSNPRFFTTPRTDVAKVFLIGDWPNIRKAYEELGIPVERLDAVAAEAQPEAMTPPPFLVSALTSDERAAVEIPEGWRDLAWTRAGDGEVSLRSLANQFSDTPILTKADAYAAIEAELQRRAPRVEPPSDVEPAEWATSFNFASSTASALAARSR